MTAPRLEVIEGRKTVVTTTRPPLPQKMPDLLAHLMGITYRADFTPAGARAACERRLHRFQRFREGSHVGMDGIVRDLRLEMCADCGAVCVRDISVDRLSGLPTGRTGPARRDLVIGWYSGARRNGREYR